MNNTTTVKKELELFCQRLSEALPAYFKLHFRLLGVADPTTHEINCSINELAKILNCNCYVLWGILACLSELRFIECPRINDHDFDKEIRIKILVRY